MTGSNAPDAVAEAPEVDGTVFAWYHEGTGSMAIGEDEDAARAFAEAYVAEQNT